MTTPTEPPLWHSRGYIPHWEAGEVAQAITFRLADSLPSALLDRWDIELQTLTADAHNQERRRRIEQALDSGHGDGSLRNFAIAEDVENALLHFDAKRYRLHAWCIMPNHVHVLATPQPRETLSSIVHSWKSFTAKRANTALNRRGSFWAPEYFDRAIRDDKHFAASIDYIVHNPVKAALCGRPDQWRFSSAWRGR